MSAITASTTLETILKALVPLKDKLDDQALANLIAEHGVTVDDVRDAYVQLEATWQLEAFDGWVAALRHQRENSEADFLKFFKEGLDDLVELDIPDALTFEHPDDQRRDITGYDIAMRIKDAALSRRFG